MFLQVVLNGLAEGCLAALLGLGISLPFLVGRFFHFSHGAICVIGVYSALQARSFGMSTLFAIVVGVVFAVVVTVLLDFLVYRPLRERRAGPAALLVASIGAFAFIESAVGIAWGPSEKAVAKSLLRRFELLGDLSVTSTQAASIAIAFLVFLGIAVTWQRSEIGLRWRACGEDPQLSELIGVNLNAEVLAALAIGTGIGVVAAFIRGLEASVYPAMGFQLLLAGLLAAVLGGLGRPTTVLWGGLILGLTQQLVAVYISDRWQDSIVFGLFLGLLLIRPHGLFGVPIRKEGA